MAYTDTSTTIKNKFKIGRIRLSTTIQSTIVLGFRPTMLCVWSGNNFEDAIVLSTYDERYATNKYRTVWTNGYSQDSNFLTTNNNRIFNIKNDGFIMNKADSNRQYLNYFAIGEDVKGLRKYAFDDETVSSTSDLNHICGFQPKQLFILLASDGMQMYDERYSTAKFKFGGASTYLGDLNLDNTTQNRLKSIENDGFKFNPPANGTVKIKWFALG